MKSFSKTILAALATGAISCLALSNHAQAVPINGDIQFQGSVSASGASGAGTTTITFAAPQSVIGTSIENGINNYSAVPNGTVATFKNFSFTGTGLAAVLSAPVVPLWTFTLSGITYSFDLTSLSGGFVSADGDTLIVGGTGVSHITGFSDTVAKWTLQGSTATGFTFALASNTTASGGVGVPDGGSTVAMLGLAMVGVEAFRRKRSLSKTVTA